MTEHDVQWYLDFDKRHGFQINAARVAHYRAVAKWLRAIAALSDQPVTLAGAVYDAVAAEMQRQIDAEQAAA